MSEDKVFDYAVTIEERDVAEKVSCVVVTVRDVDDVLVDDDSVEEVIDSYE